MDITFLIDRLEALIVAGRRLPMTHLVLMDERDLIALADQMHAVVPDEFVKASQIVMQRDNILDAAQLGGEDKLRQAEQQAAQLVQEQAIVRASEARAAQIIGDAQVDAAHLRSNAEADAASLRAGAEEYTAAILSALEDTLNGQLTQVRSGRAALHSTPRKSAQASQPASRG